MLKLLFWGAIGYVVYRYFQMKKEIKEGTYHHAAQQREGRKEQPQAEAPNRQNDGEFIDYEELK
jgi:hypothetical protein